MLDSISLQNFRSYKKAQFDFSPKKTVIVGRNTAGKTNLIEAIFLLSTGKSFKGRDIDMLQFGKEVARVTGEVDRHSGDPALAGDSRISSEEMLDSTSMTNGQNDEEKMALTVIIGVQEQRVVRKFLVNDVAKSRMNFVGNLPAVLFTPLDLELITGSPGGRRRYLDFILEQTDSEYRRCLTQYEKCIKQRNRLLEEAKKTHRKNNAVFAYWDELLIENGNMITKKREALIDYINAFSKDIFSLTAVYDKSVISKERLLQYEEQEIQATVTLVGPHRDDILLQMNTTNRKNASELVEIKVFGSRGQQRLAVLQLKAMELAYLEQILGEKPLLLLDDIFSELDQGHINLVLSMLKDHQTILTTTHKEFFGPQAFGKAGVIELE